MRQNTKVTFAMRDLDRLKCIQAVVDGDLKPIRAADRLGLTTRQVRRLARRYAAAGPAGLISKRFNRPSNNRTDDALADAVIKILRSTYAGFGPTLATETSRIAIYAALEAFRFHLVASMMSFCRSRGGWPRARLGVQIPRVPLSQGGLTLKPPRDRVPSYLRSSRRVSPGS